VRNATPADQRQRTKQVRDGKKRRTKALVTRASLRDLLYTSNDKKRGLIIGRALSLLRARTQDESKKGGFDHLDKEQGMKSGETFDRRGSVPTWVVSRWMRQDLNGYPRLCKYHRQLNEEAVKKAQGKDHDTRRTKV